MERNHNILSVKSAKEEIESYQRHLFLNNNVPLSFSPEIASLKPFELPEAPCKRRVDFTSLNAFTIDCDTTKDMDDAVSIRKRKNTYELGVHIADVSAYVQPGSSLDEEAMNRGSSIYLPLITIPMLPPVLSDDLCSLKPTCDRSTISVLMYLDPDANLLSYTITKSKIRSRLKGTYSEVNALLEGRAKKSIRKRYLELKSDLLLMEKFAMKLRAKRAAAGARIHSEPEMRYILSDRSIDVVTDDHGISGQIVEEFMVLANHVMAEFFAGRKLPALYRIQKRERTQASYSFDVAGHAELALAKYMHFTSPIRRLADLKVHQILSLYLDGMPAAEIMERCEEHMKLAAELATKRSRRSANIQRAVERRCHDLCQSDDYKNIYIHTFSSPGFITGQKGAAYV